MAVNYNNNSNQSTCINKNIASSPNSRYVAIRNSESQTKDICTTVTRSSSSHSGGPRGSGASSSRVILRKKFEVFITGAISDRGPRKFHC